MSDRYVRLTARHQRLEERLRLLRRAHWADPFEIARLKKLKLALKDRLAALMRSRRSA